MANKKRLIDANADEGGEVTKIKTHHARIVVDGTADKPYYSIEWYDPIKKEYYLGYSSYYIGNVFHWLSECFEIVDAPTVDAIPVVHGRWEKAHIAGYLKCNCCKDAFIYEEWLESGKWNYCPNCGARMDGDGNG